MHTHARTNARTHARTHVEMQRNAHNYTKRERVRVRNQRDMQADRRRWRALQTALHTNAAQRRLMLEVQPNVR